MLNTKMMTYVRDVASRDCLGAQLYLFLVICDAFLFCWGFRAQRRVLLRDLVFYAHACTEVRKARLLAHRRDKVSF